MIHSIGIVLVMENGCTDADYEYILSICCNACDIKMQSYDWQFAEIRNDGYSYYGREYRTQNIPADITYTNMRNKISDTLMSLCGDNRMITFALD